MQVKVPAGQAMVRGHYYSSTDLEVLTVAAAHPTLGRIDNVVLELDPSANSIILSVVTGTAAVSPAAPSLVQTDAGVYQLLLGRITVDAAATTIAAGKVTDARTFLGATEVAWASITGKPTSYSSAIITTASTDKSANYTLTSADKNTYIRSTNSAITITVPDVLSDGENVNFIQAGAGQITFAGSGITLNSADGLLKTAKQFAGATVVKSGGAYYLIGNLGA